MKILKMVLFLSFFIASKSFAGSYYHNDFVKNICYYVYNDNGNKLRSQLHREHLRINQIFNKIQCNNLDILQFSIKSSSTEVGKYIIKKISPTLLRKSNIVDWSLQNKLSDSPILSLIHKKLNS